MSFLVWINEREIIIHRNFYWEQRCDCELWIWDWNEPWIGGYMDPWLILEIKTIYESLDW